MCRECPEGCAACSSSTKCSSCLNTYGLTDGLCLSCNTEHCQTCEASTDSSGNSVLNCKTCSEKYTLNTDQCGLCPKNCKECNFNKKFECKTCKDGYVKTSDGSCKKCPENCEMCIISSNNSVKCTKCISNSYFLQNDGLCKRCEELLFPNCQICSSSKLDNKLTCERCFSGYALKQDKQGCVPVLLVIASCALKETFVRNVRIISFYITIKGNVQVSLL